ncbi:MAG TPA: universal stress protein [Acidimicrobiales bacterium]|nr:universal stress protein [Acidimicrobiales bacterium]
MAAHHTTASTDRPAVSTPFTAATVDVAHIVVPLDGSPFAERALPVAAWAADATGARLRLVEVVHSDEEAEGATRYLDAVTRQRHAHAWDVLRGDDVPAVLAEAVTAVTGGLACLATHGRDRSVAVLGSVAASVLDASDRPVLLAGPSAQPVEPTDAPVVVAVDGTDRDERLMPVALGWAARLGRRLLVVTVAEPAPPGPRGAPSRARGPDDPEGYVASLAARSTGTGVTVEGQVVYDPVSVRDGLVPHLDRVAALVVVGSRRRDGLPRLVLGTHAARLVHDAPVPALAVPLQD